MRAAALRVVDDVGAAAADRAHPDRAAAALGDDAVVAPAQVEAHLPGLARREAPVEVGRLRLPRRAHARDLDLDVAALEPAHPCDLRRVGGLHVHVGREVAVVAVRFLDERVAALLQRAGETLSVDRVPLRGHPACGALDHLVGEVRLQALRALAPRVVRQLGQEPAVLLAAVVRQAEHLVVLRAERADLRDEAGGRAHEEALVPRERLVAVLRDRVPQRVPGSARPAPLLAVAVEVGDEHVEEAGAQVLAHRGPVVGARREPSVHLHVVDDLGGALEPGVARLGRGRVLRERAHDVREVLAKLAEHRVVGHHHDAYRHGGDEGRFRELVDDERAGRVLRRHLVLHELLDEGLLQVLGEDVRRVLVDAAERIGAAVGAAQREPLRLLSAHAARRGEAARLAGEVEHLRRDRRRPQPPVRAAEHDGVEAAGRVLRAHDSRCASPERLPRRRRSSRRTRG